MAARRLSPRYLIAAALLSVGAAAATFQLKYAVRDLDRELAADEGRSPASCGPCSRPGPTSPT